MYVIKMCWSRRCGCYKIKCRRLVHYYCTKLPVYMIQQLLRSKHERCQCVNCVKITEGLHQKFEATTRKNENIIKLTNEIKCCENIIQMQNESLSNFKAKVRKAEKFQENLNGIKESIKLMLEDSVESIERRAADTIKKEVNLIAEKLSHKRNDETKLTYSQIAQQNNNEFRSILKDENEKLIKEEKNIQSRSCNIVIHDAPEMSSWSEEYLKEVNKRKITNLMKVMELDFIPKSIIRLGTRGSDKQRPLKVVFNSEVEHKTVMKSLGRLKNSDYKNISITEDLTIKERSTVKNMVEEAKKKNIKEENNNSRFIWRVRGSPRTNLYLKKVLKRVDDDSD